MQFADDPRQHGEFPQLSVVTLFVRDVTAHPEVSDTANPFSVRASRRREERPGSEFPEIATDGGTETYRTFGGGTETPDPRH